MSTRASPEGRTHTPLARTGFAALQQSPPPHCLGPGAGGRPWGWGAASRRLLNPRPAPEGPALPLGRNPGSGAEPGGPEAPPRPPPPASPSLPAHPTQPGRRDGGERATPLGRPAGARRAVRGTTDGRPQPGPTHPAGGGSAAVTAPFPPSPESETPGQAPGTSSPRDCFPEGGARRRAGGSETAHAARPGRPPGGERRTVALATPAGGGARHAQSEERGRRHYRARRRRWRGLLAGVSASGSRSLKTGRGAEARSASWPRRGSFPSLRTR